MNVGALLRPAAGPYLVLAILLGRAWMSRRQQDDGGTGGGKVLADVRLGNSSVPGGLERNSEGERQCQTV